MVHVTINLAHVIIHAVAQFPLADIDECSALNGLGWWSCASVLQHLVNVVFVQLSI